MAATRAAVGAVGGHAYLATDVARGAVALCANSDVGEWLLPGLLLGLCAACRELLLRTSGELGVRGLGCGCGLASWSGDGGSFAAGGACAGACARGSGPSPGK